MKSNSNTARARSLTISSPVDAPSGLGRALRMAGLTAGVTGRYLGYMLQGMFLGEQGRERKRRSTHAKAGRQIRN